MNDESKLLLKHLMDLANKSYNSNIFTFSNYLSEGEIADFLAHRREYEFAGFTIFGGNDDTERNIIRFGNMDELGYEEDFPIACIKVVPVLKKFSDDLGHRDYLGALMNLGIERDKVGDILINDKEAYVYCDDAIKEYIIENLTKIKHTVVKLEYVELSEGKSNKEPVQKQVMVASLRYDIVIAKVYNLSRSQVIELFRERKVFCDGYLLENNSGQLKEGNRVSVRGYGRFRYLGIGRTTVKGKLMIDISLQ
ncbi:MAG: hypothetical protein IJD02_04975 [Lachnospiraceae bacterium]|nr:hypothetical protein [Lachnospiraceae bacterium]